VTVEGGADVQIGPAVTSTPRRRGAPARGRIAGVAPRRLLVYLPLLPALFAFVVLLGYPVFLAITISFQKMGLRELISRETVWVGFQNYITIFSDPTFWTITVRTIGFTVVNVVLTIVLGMGIALLLGALGKWLRLALSIALILAWATPALTASVIFQWLFDSKFGIVNWALTSIGIFGDYTNHSWFATGLSTFFVIGLLIVWQAIPFVAFSLRAGILSIPTDQYEAARVDGASDIGIFRRITLPSILPLVFILTFLSAIWDFKVFTQIWTVRQGGPDGQTVTLAISAYLKGIAQAQYGVASAIAVVMVLILAVLLIPYLRTMFRSEETA
jgi:N,N'-diacetylchitobiose transport system permease protein